MTSHRSKPAFVGARSRYPSGSVALVLAGLIGFGGTWVSGAQDNEPRKSNYALTVVAKTGDVIDGKRIVGLTAGGINNQGTIAFTASFEDGQGTRRQGIFTTESGLVVQAGDVIEGRTLIQFSAPAGINDAGTILFAAFSSDAQGNRSSGLFTQSESLAQVGDTIGGKTLIDFCASSAINNSGTVAFTAKFPRETPPTFGGPQFDEGLFTQDDLLVRVGDTIDGQTVSTFGCGGFVQPAPSINNLGTITFTGGTGIFTADGNLVAKPGDTIADGRILTSVFGPRINDNGVIAFSGGFDDTHGIVTRSGFLIERGERIDGQTYNGLVTNGFHGFSNSGKALFIASFNPEGRSGLATQSDLVVLDFDTIDGRRVGGASWPFINDRDMIAFTIGLQNPDTGVFDATAIVLAVPEPE